jgi:hypothetical protein
VPAMWKPSLSCFGSDWTIARGSSVCKSLCEK